MSHVLSLVKSIVEQVYSIAQDGRTGRFHFFLVCCSVLHHLIAAICPVLEHISVHCGMHQSTFFTTLFFTINKTHNFLPDMIPHTQVPVYAHVKEVVDPQGNLEAVEINYMKFLAFNGSYKVCAVPCCAVLCCAVPCCAALCCAALRYSMLRFQCCIHDCMIVTDSAHMTFQGVQPGARAIVKTSACCVMMCSCLTGSTLGRWELMMGTGSTSPSGSPQMLGRCWASTTAHTGTCQQLTAEPWQNSDKTQQPFGLVLLKLACYITLDFRS